MRKASWTKCFAAGGGERGRLGWDGSCEKGGWTAWVAGLEWDLNTLARSIPEAASSVVGKRSSQAATFMFSAHVIELLRHAWPRPLAEKRCPCAAAVGATRAVDVIVTPRLSPGRRRCRQAGSMLRAGLRSSAGRLRRLASGVSTAAMPYWTSRV